MAFLTVIQDKVQPKEGAMELQAVKDLYNRDKTDSKKFFNDCITYIYWVYSKESICANKYPEDRKRFVIANFLPTRKIEDFDSHKHVVAVIDLYNELNLTLSERFYEDLKRDMEEMLNHLRSIPWTRKKAIEKNVEVYIKGEPFNTPVKVEIEHDNSEEKLACITRAEKIIDLEEKLKAKVYKEQKEKKGGVQRRKFEIE